MNNYKVRNVYYLMINDNPFKYFKKGYKVRDLIGLRTVKEFNTWLERKEFVNRLLDRQYKLKLRRYKLYAFEVVIVEWPLF